MEDKTFGNLSIETRSTASLSLTKPTNGTNDFPSSGMDSWVGSCVTTSTGGETPYTCYEYGFEQSGAGQVIYMAVFNSS